MPAGIDNRYNHESCSIARTVSGTGAASPVTLVAQAAAALCVLTPLAASAQEALVSTSVAAPGAVTATSRINLNTVTPKPGTIVV